jgi:hypothetical protein
MFQYLRERLDQGGVRDFVGSVWRDFKKFGDLTDGQYEAIKKIYRRCLAENGYD